MLGVIAVLSLAVYRVTRFLIEDSLIDEPRLWLRRKVSGNLAGVSLVNGPDGPTPKWRSKVLDLLECPYCLSVWVAAGAVALASWTWSAPQPFWTWLAVAGLSVAIYVKIED